VQFAGGALAAAALLALAWFCSPDLRAALRR
jgi:hypothetical protein